MQNQNQIKVVNPLVLILITLLCLISLYLVLQPLQQQQPKIETLQTTITNYNNNLGYKVINKYTRNLSELFYTQGFKFKNSSIIAESAGLYGESEIHYMNSQNFQIVQKKKLSSKYFGEGCAFYINSQNQSEIHQLTWRERKVIIYDANSLEEKRTVDLPQQMDAGWGLATIENQEPGKSQFLATDGSHYVFYIQPEDWTVIKTLQVHNDKKRPLSMLNDLEIVEDKILINIYLTTQIIELELETGNYIRVFITGKKWPFIYEIKFDNQEAIKQ